MQIVLKMLTSLFLDKTMDLVRFQVDWHALLVICVGLFLSASNWRLIVLLLPDPIHKLQVHFMCHKYTAGTGVRRAMLATPTPMKHIQFWRSTLRPASARKIYNTQTRLWIWIELIYWSWEWTNIQHTQTHTHTQGTFLTLQPFFVRLVHLE